MIKQLVARAIRPIVGGFPGPGGPPRWLRWSARRLVVTAAIVLGLGWSLPTAAVCQLAPLEDVKECFSDPSGVCCVVVFHTAEGKCAGAYCQDYDVCEWKVFIPVECH